MSVDPPPAIDEAAAAVRPKGVRFEQLDTLRGLAAMTVVLGHFTNVFADSGPTRDAIDTVKQLPTFAFIAAHEAVILFFLLSGFVLSLPWVRGRTVHYGGFLVKRVFRIYVPYAVMILAAIAGSAWLSRGEIPALSDWFNQTWTDPVTAGSVLQHVLMLGNYADYQYNTAIWSLIHEMRISIIFPLLMIVVMGWRTWAAVGAALGLSLAGLAGTSFMPETNVFLSVHYTGLFIVGALIAKHLDRITGWYRELSGSTKLAFLAASAFCYLYGRFAGPLHDWMVAAGACGFIVTALGSGRVSGVLHLPALTWLGRVSYSVYLLHSVILFGLVHLLYGSVSLWLVLPVYLALVLVASQVYYHAVEMPAMQVGRRLAQRWSPRAVSGARAPEAETDPKAA